MPDNKCMIKMMYANDICFILGDLQRSTKSVISIKLVIKNMKVV
jgi:hypothetical protein